MQNNINPVEIIKFFNKLDIAYFFCNKNSKIIDKNHIFDQLCIDAQELEEQLDLEFTKKRKKQYIQCKSGLETFSAQLNLIHIEQDIFYFTVDVINSKQLAKDELYYIENFLKNAPIATYMKDRNGIYAHSNNFNDQITGASPINKSDFDLQWDNNANELVSNDRKVLASSKQQYFYEKLTIKDKPYTFLTVKTPYKDLVYGFSIDLYNAHKILLQKNIHLRNNFENVEKLSQDDFKYLYWLTQGKSAWEISLLMNKSKKTVEFHLNRAKKALNCQRISKLAYLLGLYHGFFNL